MLRDKKIKLEQSKKKQSEMRISKIYVKLSEKQNN